ncbi:MAG: hypothetical protein ACRDI3_05800 [Actinomycetota bacterium]
MRRILMFLLVVTVLVLPAASAYAGPVEDVEEAYGQVKCLVTHGYFYCYGD